MAVFRWNNNPIQLCTFLSILLLTTIVTLQATAIADPADTPQDPEYNALLNYKQKKNTCENTYDTCMREIQKDPRYCKKDLDTCIGSIEEKPEAVKRQLPEEEEERLNRLCSNIRMYCSQKGNEKTELCKRELRKCNWYLDGSFHY